jgi:hypothetical protein
MIHKWDDIRSKLSPERQAKADDMVRKELVKMNSLFGFHRFGPTCWQFRLGPLWITRDAEKLTVWWGSHLTLFNGTFWSKTVASDEAPKHEMHDMWMSMRNARKIKQATETPVARMRFDIPEYLNKDESICACSATYCGSEKSDKRIHGLFKEPKLPDELVSMNDLLVMETATLPPGSLWLEENKNNIPSPSSFLAGHQHAYWYPGTAIWETYRKYFGLTEEEAKVRWSKKE